MRASSSVGISNHYWLFTLAISALLIAPILLNKGLLFALYLLPCILLLFLFYTDFEIRYPDLAIITCFAAFLLPSINISDSIPVIRPGFALSLFVFPLILLNKRETINESTKSFLKLYLLFLGYQVFSILHGKFSQGVQIGYKDFVEIIRVGSYLIIILLFSNVKPTENKFRKFLWAINILFLNSALIGLFQYYGILSLDSITAPLYSSARLWHVNTRMFGTFVNPNTYGTFISIGITLAVSLLFFEKKKSLKAGAFVIFLILFWTLVLTESRTALITLFAGLFVFVFVYNIWTKGDVIASIKSLTAFIIVFAALFAVMSSALIDRFSTILNIMEDVSWQMRLFAWYINIKLFLQSWVFGYGPAFHQYTPTVDSDYILILRRYGVVGFISYLTLYIHPIRLAFRNLKGSSIYTYFKIFMISSFVIVLIGNITNSLFHEMQFMNFWAVMIGILYSINSNISSIDDLRANKE